MQADECDLYNGSERWPIVYSNACEWYLQSEAVLTTPCSKGFPAVRRPQVRTDSI